MEHKNGGEIIRKMESSGSEDTRHKESRGKKVLKCMYANLRSIVRGVYKYFSGFSGFSGAGEVYKYLSGGVYKYFSGVYKY